MPTLSRILESVTMVHVLNLLPSRMSSHVWNEHNSFRQLMKQRLLRWLKYPSRTFSSFTMDSGIKDLVPLTQLLFTYENIYWRKLKILIVGFIKGTSADKCTFIHWYRQVSMKQCHSFTSLQWQVYCGMLVIRSHIIVLVHWPHPY